MREWTVVSYRRRLRRSLVPQQCDGAGFSRSRDCVDGGEEELKQLGAAVKRAIDKVEHSAFYRALRAQLLRFSGSRLKSCLSKVKGGCKVAEEEDAPQAAVELIVYGIGSIEASESSRCQLGLALLLRRDVETISVLRVYDPILSSAEVRAMEQLGCVTDAHSSSFSSSPTLFFMPHCGARLYESVLEANWSALGRIAILGNSFRRYAEQRGVPRHLLEGHRRAEEYALADMDFPTTSAFNDMSWHFFP